MLSVVTALTVVSGNIQARDIQAKSTYAFGFAASFTDSVVHFTEIQQIDSAWFDSKSKFILSRDNYSYQLRDYLSTQLNLPHRTCIFIYGDDRKKLEKKYLKMKRQYATSAKNSFDIRVIPTTSFQFRAIDMSYVNEVDESASEAEQQGNPDKKQGKPDKKREKKRY